MRCDNRDVANSTGFDSVLQLFCTVTDACSLAIECIRQSIMVEGVPQPITHREEIIVVGLYVVNLEARVFYLLAYVGPFAGASETEYFVERRW